jgi:hypothetical protein
MAIPSPLYYACFPLQEYFVDKDTGFPLAAGQVFFYEDTNRSVLKNVYQQEQQPNGEYQFALLPNPLTLSSVGTFQDNSGNDIIPFLYPFTGLPAAPTGILDLYFIEVYNSLGVLQFTREAWPPNSYGTSPASSEFQLSQNILTNTQFSSISYIPDPTTGSLTFNASPTATSVEFAPGWEIVTTGTGTVVITQIPLNASIISEAPYAIQIASAGAGLTSVQLRQRISESPRILYGDYVSGLFLISNQNLASVAVQMSYVPSTGAQYIIAQGVTANDASFSPILGVNDLSVILNGAVNTDAPPAGYVDIYIDFPVLSTVQITSTQIVQVANAETFANFVQLSVPQQTNSTFYWSKPKLEYKPIPSYTLGWDFNNNPYQEMGQSSITYSPAGGQSKYCADQTILFQTATGNISVQKIYGNGIQFTNLATATAFAMIQYLDKDDAVNLLNSPLCSQIKGLVTNGPALEGQIDLYWTADAALPDLGTNFYSLVSSVSDAGVPTVGGGGAYGTWNKVNRGNLGDARFSLYNTETFSFAGWDATNDANINTAEFFAIVVSFAKALPTQVISLEWCTLQKGYIPTAPAAMSFRETIAGLQQYYEKSYDRGTLAGAITQVGAEGFSLSSSTPGAGFTRCYASAFTITFKQSKRKIPAVALYSPNSGLINNIYCHLLVDNNSTVGDRAVFTYFASNIAQNNVVYESIYQQALLNVNYVSGTAYYTAWARTQWVADARFGIV